ncbi:MAG: hypothetical protein IPG11_14050 [Flavobacteriales bacterium]|nr:hypothetical protein [Flavobacteriales bacterium]
MRRPTAQFILILLSTLASAGGAQAQEYSDPMLKKALSEPMVLLLSCRDNEIVYGQYRNVEYGQVNAAELMDALGGRETRKDSAMCVSYNVRNAPEDVQRAFDLAYELGYGHVLVVLENPPDHVIGKHAAYVAVLYKAGKGKKFTRQKPQMELKTVKFNGLCKKLASKLE